MLVCVNSLAPLVRKIRDPHIETIVNTLTTNMFSDSERLRDISSVGKCVYIFDCGFQFLTGLKTVIGELSHLSTQVTASVSRTITRKLLTAFKNPVSVILMNRCTSITQNAIEHQSLCDA